MIPKFRAWNKRWKRMYYSEQHRVVFYVDMDWAFLHGSDGIEKMEVTNRNGILMQSTGLKDKNGKEIFEGDIVKLSRKPSPICEVIWMEDSAGFSIVNEKEDVGYYIDRYELKVIGNIHENPELVKGGSL